MNYLLGNEKLTFAFGSNYVACYNVYYYQINGILSFAVLDLAYKIIKQHKREYIILKKRKPIIHLLNYVDVLNFNSNKISIIFPLKCKYKTKLAYNLYYYRSKHFKSLDYELLKASLKLTISENSFNIKFDRYETRLQPQNVNLVAMLIRILGKIKSDEINVNGMLSYSIFLM